MNQSTRSRIAAALVSAAIAVSMASGCGEVFSSSGGAGGAGGSSAPSSGVTGDGTMASSSSSNSAATSSATSSTSSGIPLGGACIGEAGGCASGLYCKDMQCEAGTGMCVERAKNQALMYDPVCGCNGLSFWNASVAATYGTSVHHGGVCSQDEAVTCSGQSDCDASGANCMLQATSCTTAPEGVCMVPHDSCELTSLKAKTCTNGCEKVCKLISDSTPFNSPGGC